MDGLTDGVERLGFYGTEKAFGKVLVNGIKHKGATMWRKFVYGGTVKQNAINTNGSGTSIEGSIKTAPNTPENITVDRKEDSLTFEWDRVPGASGYDLVVDGEHHTVTADPDGSGLVGGNDPSKTIDQLAPGTDHTYQLSSINEEGSKSNYSKEETTSTKPQLPSAPAPSAEADLNDITITWEAIPGVEEYEITFDGKTELVTGTSKTYHSLEPNSEHMYQVRSKDEAGYSPYSPETSITTDKSLYAGRHHHSAQRTYPDGRQTYTGLEPVNAINGAFLWSYTYLEEYGPDILNFTLMYDSQGDESPGHLGSKWTYSLNYLLKQDGTHAYFITPYSEVIPFEKNGSSFEAEEDSEYTLEASGDSYIVSYLDEKEYHFDVSSQLEKIIEGGVATYLFEKNSSNQITSIAGQHGKQLTLTYANGLLASISDPMGHMVHFTYGGATRSYLKRIGMI